jgi:hypothetical protein
MERSFFCLLLMLSIPATHSFMQAFLADDSAVFPVLPNASCRFPLLQRALSPDRRETPPRASASWSKLNHTPILNRITRNEANTRRVEDMLTDLIAVLIHADDCTLLERQTQDMGAVYLDTNFTMSRPPLLLRAGVREIMGRYNLPLRPVERKWTCDTDNTTSVRI